MRSLVERRKKGHITHNKDIIGTRVIRSRLSRQENRVLYIRLGSFL